MTRRLICTSVYILQGMYFTVLTKKKIFDFRVKVLKKVNSDIISWKKHIGWVYHKKNVCTALIIVKRSSRWDAAKGCPLLCLSMTPPVSPCLCCNLLMTLWSNFLLGASYLKLCRGQVLMKRTDKIQTVTEPEHFSWSIHGSDTCDVFKIKNSSLCNKYRITE